MKESNEDTEWEPDINWVKLAQQTGCEARSLAEACSLPVGLCKEVFQCIFHRALAGWLQEVRLSHPAAPVGERQPGESRCAFDLHHEEKEPNGRLINGKQPLQPCEMVANYLHVRIAAGEQPARELLVKVLRQSLERYARGRFPAAGTDILADAVTDAFLDYFHHPQGFDPKKKTLAAFLRMAAWRNARDRMRKENRHRRVLTALAECPSDVKRAMLSLPFPPDDPYFCDPATQLILSEQHGNRKSQLEGFLGTLTETDRKIVDLQLHGKRGTNEFAQALGITSLPELSQRKEVNKAKNRLHKALSRWVGTHAKAERSW